MSLAPRNDGKESLTKQIYRLGREEIEEEVMEARELKASNAAAREGVAAPLDYGNT